jgi:ATP-dependent DNA helicase DinG
LAFAADVPEAPVSSKPSQRVMPSGRRYSDRELAQLPLLVKTFGEAIEAVNKLAELLEFQKDRHEELEKLAERCTEVAEGIDRFLKAEDATNDKEQRVPRVRWAEVGNQGASFNTTPLAVGPLFKDRIAKEKRAWIFTSATLSVRNNFEHFQGDMGLEDATTATWDSPFDYGNHALLYVPSDMPETNAPNYAKACIDALYPALKASQGRAFVLFTNLRTMQQAATEIKQR